MKDCWHYIYEYIHGEQFLLKGDAYEMAPEQNLIWCFRLLLGNPILQQQLAILNST